MATETAPTLADIEAARERGSTGKGVRVTPLYASETFGRMTGRAGRAEGGEPPADGLVQDPRRRQQARDADRGGAQSRRRRRERGQPRAGGRLGGARGRHRGDDLHAGGGADGEGRADAQLRRAGRARRARRSRTRCAAALAHVEETGATFVHPFEDPVVIAGQGTIGLELAEQLPDARDRRDPGRRRRARVGDRARAARAAKPDVTDRRRPGGGCAPLAGSAELGYTIADGIAVKQPGELTSRILDDLLDDDRHRHRRGDQPGDRPAARARRSSSSRARAPQPSRRCSPGSVGGSGPAVAILSGGNIDPTLLIQVMRHGLTLAGRYLVVRTRIPDRPGELIKLLSLFAESTRTSSRSSTTARAWTCPSPRPRSRLTLLDARPGALRGDPRRDAAARLRRRPVALAMHVCPQCGRENAADARFCSSCGAALAVAARAGARGAQGRHRALRRPRRLHVAGGADRPGGRARDARAVSRASARRARAPRRHRREVHRRRGDGALRRADGARGRSRARRPGGARDPRLRSARRATCRCGSRSRRARRSSRSAPGRPRARAWPRATS